MFNFNKIASSISQFASPREDILELCNENENNLNKQSEKYTEILRTLQQNKHTDDDKSKNAIIQRNFTQFSLNQWKEPSSFTSFTNIFIGSVFNYVPNPFKIKKNIKTELPEDIVFHILGFLSPLERKKLEHTNTVFQSAMNRSLTDTEKKQFSFRELQDFRPNWLPKKYITSEGSIENSSNFITDCILCSLPLKERENRLHFFFNSLKSSDFPVGTKTQIGRFRNIKPDSYSAYPFSTSIPKKEIISTEPCKQVKTQEHRGSYELVDFHCLRGIYADGKHILQSRDKRSHDFTCMLMILLDQGKKIKPDFLINLSMWLENCTEILSDTGVTSHALSINSTSLEEWQELTATYDSIYIQRHETCDEKLGSVIVDAIDSETVTLRDPSQGRRVKVSTTYFLSQMTEERTCIGIIDKENM